MNDVIPILRDIVLEAQTTSKWLEHGDMVIDSMEYIEDLAKSAIEKLEEHVDN